MRAVLLEAPIQRYSLLSTLSKPTACEHPLTLAASAVVRGYFIAAVAVKTATGLALRPDYTEFSIHAGSLSCNCL
jgi:hypothetical protein